MGVIHENNLPRHSRHARWYVYAGSVDLGLMTLTIGPTYEWAEPAMNNLPLKWAGYYEPTDALVKTLLDGFEEEPS